MISIYYGSKKIILKCYECKFENNLRDAKLTLSDVDNISEFLKSDTGEDIEIIAGKDKNGKKLSSVFKFIDAAGGLVKNEKNEYLFIFRRKRWDLPKGKLDKGETIEEAALREVKEESGLKAVLLEHFICPTYHIYPLNETFVIKTTYWYLMSASCTEKLKPQTEEDITEIMWLAPEKISKIKANTFPSILEVINRF